MDKYTVISIQTMEYYSGLKKKKDIKHEKIGKCLKYTLLLKEYKKPIWKSYILYESNCIYDIYSERKQISDCLEPGGEEAWDWLEDGHKGWGMEMLCMLIVMTFVKIHWNRSLK